MLATLRRKSRPLFWVVGPTYELLEQAQGYFRDALMEAGITAQWSGWLGQSHIYTRCTFLGCVVEWKSAEHPNRLVSRPVDGMWLNEAARLKEEAWQGNLSSRLMATGGWVVMDSSPMGENWVYRDHYIRGLEPGDPDYDAGAIVDTAPRCSRGRRFCAHTWATDANPGADKALLELKRLTLQPWAYLREVKGDPHNFAGQLFPSWTDGVNVKTLLLDDYPELVFGLDWGFGPGHPFALIVCGVDTARRRFHIADEYVREGMLFDDQVRLIAQYAERYPRVRKAIGDSADPGMLALARARMPRTADRRVIDFIAAQKDVLAGVGAQGELIGAGGYTVDPTCKVTIRQHKGARWKPIRSGDPMGGVVEEPLRKDEDTVAAARYVVYPRLARARQRAA